MDTDVFPVCKEEGGLKTWIKRNFHTYSLLDLGPDLVPRPRLDPNLSLDPDLSVEP